MVNGFGGGGIGGGFGHDCSQSTQAHGSVLFWKLTKKIPKNIVTEWS